MGMTGYDLGKAVGDADKRFIHIFFLHAASAEQCTVGGVSETFFYCGTTHGHF
jgi:hypothetical protein